jgi:hypothetical protein
MVAMAVGACTASSAPPASADSTDSPASASPPPAGNLPPGCEPIELRAQDGGLVVLDGPWVEAEPPETGPMTWWFRALGDCVWGVGTADGVGPVQNLRGTLRRDFTIDSEVAFLGERDFFGSQIAPLTQVRLLIEFEEGGVILREDRAPGAAGGPRCPEFNNCLVPLVLVPDD